MTNHSIPKGVKAVSVVHKANREGGLVEEECWVIEECVLNIRIAGVGGYSLMWTPVCHSSPPYGFTREEGLLGCDELPEALAIAAGFMLSEGLIRCLDDLRSMSVCADTPDVVQVELAANVKPEVRRKDVVINSSCGVCGGREELERGLEQLPQVGRSLTLPSGSFVDLMSAMRQNQKLFVHTGSAHSAAVIAADGRQLAQCEDLGRHNAMDKVIGSCLLRGIRLQGCAVLLSSRLSLEMVAKAAKAGFELIAAVSAPTSLAIEVAERCGITLCGFVRDERLTIYSHPQRITLD